ncbi:MAG: Hpt domain-containing protein [Alphaproteobacteria bacterium]
MTDGQSGRATLIQRPNTLKAKVGMGGNLSAEMRSAADRAVGTLATDYPALALTDINRMLQLLQSAKSDPARAADTLQAVHRIAHDMRGQGGSFGYPLMTRIAASLSLLTENARRHDAEMLGVVRAHLDAMRAIIVNRTTGDGDATAQQIVRGLDLVARKVKG